MKRFLESCLPAIGFSVGVLVGFASILVFSPDSRDETVEEPETVAVEEPEKKEEPKREFDDFTHDVSLDGVPYFIVERRYRDTGESEWENLHVGVRSWRLMISDPLCYIKFLQSHGTPVVSRSKEGLVEIFNDRGELLMTFSDNVKFLLHAPIRWVRLQDESTAKKVVDSIIEKRQAKGDNEQEKE